MPLKSVVNRSSISWADIHDVNLSEPILNALKALKFNGPKPVQAATISLFLKHKDVCVEAVTGSGKTLAFVIPILEMLLIKHKSYMLDKYSIMAIILSPTQELAQQTHQVITEQFIGPGKLDHITCELFIGGTRSPESDLKRFASTGGHIIVATPGRLEYLLANPSTFNARTTLSTQPGMGASMTLSQCARACDILVLDEADRLLEMGFMPSLTSIMGHLPKQRRTCLFSATLNEKVDCLIKAGLRNPISIVVKETLNRSVAGKKFALTGARTPVSLNCYYTINDPCEKFKNLVWLLTHDPTIGKAGKIMVFVSSLSAAQYFTKALKMYMSQGGSSLHDGDEKFQKVDLDVLTLHRKMRSADRSAVLARFRSSVGTDGLRRRRRVVLFCTDVVARGIDVPDIDWVVQYDAPCTVEYFVHRCGRTARSERTGNALLMLLPTEEPFIEFLALNRGLAVSPLHDTPHGLPGGANGGIVRCSLDPLELMRTEAAKDRAYMLKGIKAFVSHVRSYAQHECRLIFRLKDLDLGRLATGYGLLYLPKMPEVSRQMRRESIRTKAQQPSPIQNVKNVIPRPTILPNLSSYVVPFPGLKVQNVPYLDPELENRRLEKMAELKRVKVSEIKRKKTRATITKIRNKSSHETHKLTRKERSKIKQTLDARDIAEITKDAKLLKKLRNKKITESSFDKAFYAGLG